MASEWKKLRIKDVVSFVVDNRGKTPPMQDEGHILLEVNAVSATEKFPLYQEVRKHVSQEVYDTRFRKGHPKKGDILVPTVGTLGAVSLMNRDDCCIAQNLIALRCDEAICHSHFLYYVLCNPLTRKRLLNLNIGGVQPSIKVPHLMELEIELPGISEQKKIAKLLSLMDDKIFCNKRINDNLYEMVNAYFTSLFKDVECEMTTIGNYAERIYSGGTPTTSNAAYWDGAFGWFSSGETRNRFVISTEKTITQAGIDNSSTKLAAKHDIVMASAGQGFTRGQTSMLLIDTYVNQSVIVIHAERKVLPYLFWNLANRYEELRAISDSSSIRGSLTTKMIAAFEIPLANEESLQAFADFSWSVIPQIENNLLENERLAALRDNLLPKLMSGEIDVSNIQL